MVARFLAWLAGYLGSVHSFSGSRFLAWLAGYLGLVHSFSGCRSLARFPAFLAVCLAGWVGCCKIILTEAGVSVSYHFKFCSFCKTSLVSTAFVYSEVELSPFLYCFAFLKSIGCFFFNCLSRFSVQKRKRVRANKTFFKKKSM